MKERPICAVEGCERPAFILFGEKWVCGECVTEYDKQMKKQSFNQLQEVVKDADNNLS